MGNCNCKQKTSWLTHACPECDILQLARNNYFTGKLLVERDFTDEQRYTMGKLRRHNQRLHGWGVACGLKVEPHPTTTCQAQYVVIEPGTAIDCCGREILVWCEEYFDFHAKFLAYWQQQYGPTSVPDAQPHTLQICIAYKECAVENVPALFDDCSGNSGACQPNRILESYSFDVKLNDNPAAVSDPAGVELHWAFTENIANAVRIAEDDAGKRLYVLTSSSSGGTSSAALYQIDTTNYSILGVATFAGSTGLDVALSASGKLVYVAVQPQAGAPVVNVYSSTDLTTIVNTLTIGAASDASVRLTAYAKTEGSLFTYGSVGGVTAWSGAETTMPAPTSTAIAGVASPVALVIDGKDQYAYVATTGSATLSVITVAGLTEAPAAFAFATAPVSLAIADTTLGQTLAALDTTAPALYFADIPAGGPTAATVVAHAVTVFAYPPKQVLLSPGGRWAYVLEEDTGTSNGYVQSVDEFAVEQGASSVLGEAVEIGNGPISESLSGDGSQLYVAYSDVAQPNLGGVAVLAITQTDCASIFDTLIDGCPDCEQSDCLVLATIKNYIYGNAISATDIDNLTDRHLLVSTDVLTNVVRCVLAQGGGSGTAGQQGPKGDKGDTGDKGDKGDTGPPGPGLQRGLVRVTALSWSHGVGSQKGGFLPVTITANGQIGKFSALVIAFSGDVKVPNDLDVAQIFEVLYRTSNVVYNTILTYEYLNITSEAIVPVAVTLDVSDSNLIVTATPTPGVITTGALAFVLPGDISVLTKDAVIVSVRLRGDFLMDTQNRAISATFVRAQFDTGQQPQGSDLCLEGGTFESWFRA